MSGGYFEYADRRAKDEIFGYSGDKPKGNVFEVGAELGECSNCGHSGCASDIWDGCEQMFCPNCGAYMKGENND